MEIRCVFCAVPWHRSIEEEVAFAHGLEGFVKVFVHAFF